jgi:xanthine dehydrogenase molybdopterin-binding subunit B
VGVWQNWRNRRGSFERRNQLYGKTKEETLYAETIEATNKSNNIVKQQNASQCYKQPKEDSTHFTKKLSSVHKKQFAMLNNKWSFWHLSLHPSYSVSTLRRNREEKD